MQTDYRNFKTPYFKIEIAAASSKNYVELPEHVHRLIKKIEIMETKQGSCDYAQQVLITMVEGSREPSAQTDEAALVQLYSLGPKGGALTNKVGLVTDLRFTNGSVGLTAINSANVDKAVEFLKKFSADAKTSTKIINNINIPKETPKYLFQEFNKVKLTWGYLEDPSSARVLKTVIYAWQTDFPESGQPETTITCLGFDAVLTQMAYSEAITLKDTKINKVVVDTNTGTKSEQYKGLSTKAALEYLCEQFGITPYISDKIDMNTDVPRVLPAGMSLDKFFHQVANETQCYYHAFIDPFTDKVSMVFVPKQEYDKQVALNANLFAYKQPGSIIKSIGIRADFSGFSGAYKANYKSDGVAVQAVSDNGDYTTVLYDAKVEAVPDPASNPNTVENAKKGKEKYGTSTQKAEINPNASNSAYAKQGSIKDAFCAKNRLIFMEINCLGFTKIFPPMVIQVSNIGSRYSGQYKIEAVTHTIDESGYVCRITAKTHQTTGAGYQNPNATKGETPPTQEYESQLVKPKLSAANFGKTDPNSIETFMKLVLG